MGDWKTLLAVPRFRGLWIALLCANLGSWSVLAALPILVAERYGAGSALVLSLSWRILPKIVLAPVAGVLLRRFGAPRVACLALGAEAVLTAALPWCEDFVVVQVVIAGIGALDVFVMPGMLSLRGVVTPDGLELASNSLCSMADRIGKMIGPVIGGLAVIAGFVPAFLGFAVAIALAAAPVIRLPRPRPEAASHGWTFLRLPGEFWRMLRDDRALVGLLVCAVSYMVMLGGLRPFLFWANREWFGAADTAWTGLMAAQGAGAVTRRPGRRNVQPSAAAACFGLYADLGHRDHRGVVPPVAGVLPHWTDGELGGNGDFGGGGDPRGNLDRHVVHGDAAAPVAGTAGAVPGVYLAVVGPRLCRWGDVRRVACRGDAEPDALVGGVGTDGDAADLARAGLGLAAPSPGRGHLI